ncbi:HypC/HybG/HupF family hydrogenase formation chaperone [Fodinicola feengrottensis]|uniref:Hydrogenase assembly protein HupF n=1 Tax=Fodinicola feengrottensis TaxID=435914 RepID=A0ABN2I2Q0_9ACTN|nr:HypC/HybG/HupF family hydrogenase formation chaperone [Fodinicola feengrottensis]
MTDTPGGCPTPPPPALTSPPIPRAPVCYDDVCITCSDQAVAVTVVELLPDELAVVDTGVSHEEVSVALVSARVGDTILVHAKEAIAVIDPSQAAPAAVGGDLR